MPPQLRLTEAEVRAQQAEAEAQARWVAERQARIEAEARQATEREALLWLEKLRLHGIDPERL